MKKHTLQEIADFFGCAVAQDKGAPRRRGDVHLYKPDEPIVRKVVGRFIGSEYGRLNPDLVDSKSGWDKSLTYPDGLEEEICKSK